jgi:hypothetical protein
MAQPIRQKPEHMSGPALVTAMSSKQDRAANQTENEMDIE